MFGAKAIEEATGLGGGPVSASWARFYADAAAHWARKYRRRLERTAPALSAGEALGVLFFGAALALLFL